MCGVADLIKKTYEADSVGNRVASETKRRILTEEKSISRQEWAEAGRQGIKPAFLLRTHRVNYDGEDEVEYNGKRYGVYRTYEFDETVELYLERKGGLE